LFKHFLHIANFPFFYCVLLYSFLFLDNFGPELDPFGEPRVDRDDYLRLCNIDYNWVNNQTKMKPLKQALRLLEEDGFHFPDL
jgi:glutaredoxin-related protein